MPEGRQNTGRKASLKPLRNPVTNCWIREDYVHISKPLMHSNLGGKRSLMQQMNTPVCFLKLINNSE